MEAFILISAIVCSLFLLRRQRILRQTLRDMARATREERPFIFETSDRFNGNFYLSKLQDAIDRLLQENRTVHFDSREKGRRIEGTFDHMRESVLLVNELNRVVYANAAAQGLLPPGSKTELKGGRVETLLPGASFQSYMARLRAGQRPPREEIRISGGPAMARCFEISGSVFRDDGYGAETFLLFVLHDITELRRLEEMRRDFVANVSHELKTPVTVLKGFSEAVSEDYDAMSDAQRKQFIGKINKSANRLQSIIEDLLTLSRIEGDPGSVRLEPAAMNAFIAHFVDDYRERFAQHKIALEFVPETDADRVRIDPVKCSLVLQNLFENALRHAQGATTVRVSTQAVDAKNLRVCVEDDGCGIPAADLGRVFERFYRVDKSRSRDSGGTGLGLSIVRHIVALHGGQTRAQTRTPKGVSISFTLPLSQD